MDMSQRQNEGAHTYAALSVQDRIAGFVWVGGMLAINQADPRRSLREKPAKRPHRGTEDKAEKAPLRALPVIFTTPARCQKRQEGISGLEISGLEGNHEQSRSCEPKCTANKKSGILTNHCNVPEVYISTSTIKIE